MHDASWWCTITIGTTIECMHAPRKILASVSFVVPKFYVELCSSHVPRPFQLKLLSMIIDSMQKSKTGAIDEANHDLWYQ